LPSPLQLWAQLDPLQALGRQDRVPPGTQVPLPSQVLAAVSVKSAQLPGWHSVPAPKIRQAPAPLQVPSRWQVAGGSRGQ
jgi:hypothetical protein